MVVEVKLEIIPYSILEAKVEETLGGYLNKGYKLLTSMSTSNGREFYFIKTKKPATNLLTSISDVRPLNKHES
jgi:hypothetical protein